MRVTGNLTSYWSPGGHNYRCGAFSLPAIHYRTTVEHHLSAGGVFSLTGQLLLSSRLQCLTGHQSSDLNHSSGDNEILQKLKNITAMLQKLCASQAAHREQFTP